MSFVASISALGSVLKYPQFVPQLLSGTVGLLLLAT